MGMRENEAREIVWRHLAEKPAFLALIRSIEHRLIANFRPFEAPILDAGAGDGHFAFAALGRTIEVGVDPNLARLREAGSRGAYRLLVRASAAALPFPREFFAATICNCVLEHIPEMPSALAETFRTLRPGGLLLLTVPTDRLEENLLIPQALRALGLRRLSARYLAWFRARQQHHHLLSRQEWIAAVEQAGFEIRETRGYLSARATRWFELAHYTAWMNLAARALTGRWVPWPWRPRFFFTERRIAGLVDEPEDETDSCLFVAARKPG